jgi:hypothetical protein
MPNNFNWGRFTARGSQKVEDLISRMAEETVAIIEKAIPAKDYKCLYMLGGYGRGEGGVVVVNGQERPHNNFDLMLVTGDISTEKAGEIKQLMDRSLKDLVDRIGIGIDTSVTSAGKLKSSACRIFWYDMKYGHKLLSGSNDLIMSCSKFKLKNIPAWDARNLLVNRGTLMIINDLLLGKKPISENVKKELIKNKVKSIIGYGDCLLYFLGLYHWSYVEKQKRMLQLNEKELQDKGIDPEFRTLYNDAMNFRFQPDYEPYMHLDIEKWLKESRDMMQKINLFCEAKRLHRRKLDWDNYIYLTLAQGVSEGGYGIKALGKRLINSYRNESPFPGKAPSRVKLGYKFLGEKGILPLVYPLIVYNLRNKDYRSIARSYLQVQNFDFIALRSAYLKKWGEYMDPNFNNLLKKFDIKL